MHTPCISTSLHQPIHVNTQYKQMQYFTHSSTLHNIKGSSLSYFLVSVFLCFCQPNIKQYNTRKWVTHLLKGSSSRVFPALKYGSLADHQTSLKICPFYIAYSWYTYTVCIYRRGKTWSMYRWIRCLKRFLSTPCPTVCQQGSKWVHVW